MRRRTLRLRPTALGLMVMIAALAGPGAGAAEGAALPTLGLPGPPRSKGFGEVRPPVVYLGGADPTGLVRHIHWRRWGKAKAIGRGTGWWVPPNKFTDEGHYARARLVAWDLGTCGGHRAYRRFEWYYPEYNRGGHRPPGTYFSARYAMHVCNPE